MPYSSSVTLSPASLISLVIELPTLSTTLLIDLSILCSAEFEALEPKLVISFFKESTIPKWLEIGY